MSMLRPRHSLTLPLLMLVGCSSGGGKGPGARTDASVDNGATDGGPVDLATGDDSGAARDGLAAPEGGEVVPPDVPNGTSHQDSGPPEVAGADAATDRAMIAADGQGDGLSATPPDLPRDICSGQADGADCSLGRLDKWSCHAGLCTPAVGRDGGSEPSLLQGAVSLTGPKPMPGKVRAAMDGSPMDFAAVPGHVVVLFATPVPTATNAQNAIAKHGGSVLAQIPMVGAYLVGVQPGQEDALMNSLSADAAIQTATPDLVLQREQAGGTNLPSGPAGSGGLDGGSPAGGQSIVAILEPGCDGHSCRVAEVLTANGIRDPVFRDVDLGFSVAAGVAIPNPNSLLWQVLFALVATADSARPGRGVFINMSYGYPLEENQEACVDWHMPALLANRHRDAALDKHYEWGSEAFWYTVLVILTNAFEKLPSAARAWVAVAIAAGNFGVPLDWRMQKLSARLAGRAADGGVAPSDVLHGNVMIVTQARPPGREPRRDYVASWTADTNSVIATDNSWAAYGTSFAAPYALAQAHAHFANGLSPTPSDAVKVLKQEAANNDQHIVPHVFSSATGEWDLPPFPLKQGQEIQPTQESLFSCPRDSSWEKGKGSCVFGYLGPQGQTVCPVPGLPGGTTGPWVSSLAWPDLKIQLGLGTSWIEVKPTCAFEGVTLSTASGTLLSQNTSGLIGFDCGLSSSNPCLSPATPSLGSGQSNAWNMCGVSTVASLDGVVVSGYFSAPIATRWPRLPATSCSLCGTQPSP
jgi:hypothetical protein